MSEQHVLASRYLLADWFTALARADGIDLRHYTNREDAFVFRSPAGREVTAIYTKQTPFLEFRAETAEDQAVISSIVAKAIANTISRSFGSEVWYTLEFSEAPFDMFSPFSMLSGFMLRLGAQQRIVGWRRLGASVLLNFTELGSVDSNQQGSPLAPRAAVKVHAVVPGPCHGYFSDFLMHQSVEPIAVICGFALGRPVDPPPGLFPSTEEEVAEAISKRRDATVLTLGRRGVSLDVFTPCAVDGGRAWSARARSALITFDAAQRQERDSVASILYVVAAESLALPAAKWRRERLTARFVDFYLRELSTDLDAIISHGNFEEAFGLRREGKSAETLRKRLLLEIYEIRSNQVHEGLLPTYGGLSMVNSFSGTQRGLVHDFAEAALLSYLHAPRSSLVGHPHLGCKSSGAPALATLDVTASGAS
jgi:hypothetical protein